MADLELLNRGSAANDGTGDDAREGGRKINLLIQALINAGWTTDGPPRQTVDYATAAALASNTYSAGVITATSNGALSVDGASPAAGARVLVKDEVSELKNGVYVVTQPGSASLPFILTRADDFSTWAEIVGRGPVFVEQGSANAERLFTCTANQGGTLGTTAITYAIAAVGSITSAIWGYLAGITAFVGGLFSAANLAAFVTNLGGASSVRSALSLGTAALKNTGQSGDAVPVCNGGFVTWAAWQQISNATYASYQTVGDGVSSEFVSTRYSSDATAPNLNHIKARGTLASPSDVIQSDAIARWYAIPRAGGAWQYNSYAQWVMIEPTPGAGANALAFDVWTPTIGTAVTARGLRVVGEGIRVPDGTASLPSISGLNDTNTGFTFDTGDIIGIVTGGVKRTTITTSGFLDEANGGMTLGGSGAKRWGDINIAANRKIAVNNGNAGAVTLQFASNQVTLENTDAAAVTYRVRRTDTPAAAVTGGIIQFDGKDDAGNDQQFGRMYCYHANVTNGAEAGWIVWSLASAGTHADRLQLTPTVLRPAVTDTVDLGDNTLAFGNLYLKSGGFVDFGNNNGRLTHSSGRIASSVPFGLPSYTVAGLPAGSTGDMAYASNGRKNGEGAGAGTGVQVFKDASAWRACDTGATVAA